MTCIYMEAPSLTSKADQMTIGGHTYPGGNSSILGTYQPVKVRPDSTVQGYRVSIKYA